VSHRNVQINNGDVEAGDGYRLTFEPGGGAAALLVKGPLTPARAAELIEDLTPFAVKKRRKPRAAKPRAASQGETP